MSITARPPWGEVNLWGLWVRDRLGELFYHTRDIAEGVTIANREREMMLRFMAELGLTPSSRTRLSVTPKGPKPWEFDPTAKYFE